MVSNLHTRHSEKKGQELLTTLERWKKTIWEQPHPASEIPGPHDSPWDPVSGSSPAWWGHGAGKCVVNDYFKIIAILASVMLFFTPVVASHWSSSSRAVAGYCILEVITSGLMSFTETTK